MSKNAASTSGSNSLVGKTAPLFTAPTDTADRISLKGLRGKKVVLYFYPKDDTPGCTTQAKAFKDFKAKFSRKNAVVLGVSKDTVDRHTKFRTKHKLNFTLISDSETKICEKYGVWKEKNMYGKKYMGIERSTFVIDEKGIVRAEWRKVKVTGHADEVLMALKTL